VISLLFEKKAHNNTNIAFLMLSKGTREIIKQGWFLERLRKIKTKTSKVY